MTAAVTADTIDVTAPPGRDPAWRRLLRSPAGLIGAVLVLAIVVTALSGIVGLTPHDPVAQHPLDRLLPPSGRYWFGTDQFGRDIFSRCVAGLGN